MIFKWLGPLALLAALVIGDQIRINRPGHKYRLTVEVETPEGVKSASGVMAVHPDRGYSRGGHTTHRGRCRLRRSRRRQESGRACWRISTRSLDLDGINYVALRAYTAAGGKRVSFNDMSRLTGIVPVKGALIPVLVSFADPGQPRAPPALCRPTMSRRCWGRAIGCAAITAEVVPNGYWPLDFGGALGEPVTRGIEAKLPWLNGAGQCRGHGAPRRPDCPMSRRSTQGGFHAEVALQARARLRRGHT